MKKLFLTPNKGRADENRIRKALGYPLDRVVGITVGSTSSLSSFRALDETEMHDMK